MHDLLDQRPCESRRGCGHVGIDEGYPSDPVRLEVRSGVEAEPADPQQARADVRHRQRVRGHDFRFVAEPLAENEAAHQSGDTRVDVDDRASGEVERPLAEEEPMIVRVGRREVGAAPVPNHVCDRIIDDGRPEHDEQHQRPELHALGEAADD